MEEGFENMGLKRRCSSWESTAEGPRSAGMFWKVSEYYECSGLFKNYDTLRRKGVGVKFSDFNVLKIGISKRVR